MHRQIIDHPSRERAYRRKQWESVEGLRIALVSGNYNCIKDGANNALNRLAAFLLDGGAALRIYSPTIAAPAFPATGDLVSIPSVPFPLRPEYRLALGLGRSAREDMRRFAPSVMHLAVPDRLGWQALRFGRRLGIPVVASLHTRFETYPAFYGMGFLRRPLERYLAQFYRDCDLTLAPNEGVADLLAGWGVRNVRVWSRGVDRTQFSPGWRDMEWRRRLGYGDDEMVLLFFGRIVAEKGIACFARVVARLRAEGLPVRPLVIGDGPATDDFAASLGDSVFLGHLDGPALSRAVASADILLNPSVSEAFGNVNLEAMASGVVVVSADVPSASSLVTDRREGVLVPPGDVRAFAHEIAALARHPLLRRAMARHALDRAACFEWTRTLSAVAEAYREVAGTQEGSPGLLDGVVSAQTAAASQ